MRRVFFHIVVCCIVLLIAACPVFADTSYNVTDETGLNDALINNSDTIKTINIYDNITLTGDLSSPNAGAFITINGNQYNINGNGAAGIIIDSSQRLDLEGIGSLDGGGAVLTSLNGFERADGGFVYNEGTLNTTNSVFCNNSSSTDGGVVYNAGTTTITNSTFSSNSAAGNGGAIYSSVGNLTISDSSFTGNTVSSIESTGGAIFSMIGTVTITDTSFTNNFAEYSGGAIWNDLASVMNIIDSSFTNNESPTYYGGAIRNRGTLKISKATTGTIFDGNSANLGGAIYNTNDVTISDATFTGNSANYGGAIFNDSSSTVDITDSNFTNNRTNNWGGAIRNRGTLKIYKTTTDTIFDGNSASTGGVIYNTGTVTISDTVFTGNTASGSGGAIYNASGGTITITDSIFTENTANHGGAIWNKDILYIKATAGNSTSFTTASDTVHLNSGLVYLNAGTDGTINFAGEITSDSINNVIHINSMAGDENLISGTINVNSLISDATVNVENGTLAFGSTASSDDIYTNNVNLKLSNSSILSTENNIAGDVLNVKDLTIVGEAVSIYLDADLLNNKIDTINVSGMAEGTVNIGHLNILFDSVLDTGSITIFTDASGTGDNISNLTLEDFMAYTNDYVYLFTSDTSGIYDYLRADVDGLNAAVSSTYGTRSFSALTDEDVTANLDTMGGAGSTLTIKGYSHNINGGGYAGIIVEADQTLNIEDVGSLDVDGNVDTSWNGSESTNGGVVNNAGTLNIENSVFFNNSAAADGGVIYNSGTATITNSTFSNNSATGNGGAIYNTGTLNIVADGGTTSFLSASDSIYSTSDIYLNAGDEGTITFNGAVDTTTADIYINSGSLNSGSVIFNNTVNADAISIEGGITDFNQQVTANTLDIQAGTNTFDGTITATTINSFGDTTTFNNAITADDINIATGTTNINTSLSSMNLNISSGIANIGDNSSGSINLDDINILSTGGTTNLENLSFLNNSNVQVNDTNARVNVFDLNFDGTNYTSTESIFKVLSGTLFIDPTIFTNYTKATNGGVINNADTLLIEDTMFASNAASGSGGAIYNTGDATIVNSSFFSNSSATGDGGAIYNSGNLSIIADGINVNFSNNTASGSLNDIYLDTGSSLNLNVSSGAKITFNSGIDSSDINNNININKTGVFLTDGTTAAPTNGEVVLNSAINNSTVNLYGGTLSLGADNYLDNNNLYLSGGLLNMANSTIGTMSLNSLNLVNGTTTNLGIDVDLAKGVSDRIGLNATGTYSGSGLLNVSNISILADAAVSSTNIQFLDSDLRNKIAVAVSAKKVYGPIYAYDVSYNAGSLSFAGGPSSNNFNPEVLSSPVSANTGAYMSQIGLYNEALNRAEMFMSLPNSERLLMRYRNRYAAIGTGDAQPAVFSPTFLPEARGGLWFKQFTTFENVPLNNGPNVSNVSYGSIIGGDTPLTYLGHGFDGYLTLYTAYSGSHQNYDNVGVNQNGGALGVTGTVYKNNFFSSLTASVGDSYGQANTSYGMDNFNTILAGLASKTGYNFEMLRGKIILQPSVLLAYTFAKTFNYTTASGVSVTSDPLNAVQIAPGVKLIGNTKNGWQPYLATNMIFNIMDTQKFYANDAQLPEMSISPYIEYGAGVQRKWGKRFSGFGQVMFRGGGRNGISLQFGFRYALGK